MVYLISVENTDGVDDTNIHARAHSRAINKIITFLTIDKIMTYYF